ncbi:MAG: flagellar M-ring protein FliF [Deltaproteobacteria bacterium]|nr:flagellar M-ring protein FliF [Deltaproteobacteria bacterium]
MEKIFELLKQNRKTAALGVVAAVITAVVALFLFNQGPEYKVLFSQLSPEDSGAVIEKLKEKRIEYKVDGTTISVPAEKVYETRMELAGEGLPQGGGVGFEIFDKTSFGVTDFVQKINYRRALQGELARTISQIKEIESARVHLALPEKGVFLDEQKKARASIIVKLKPGKTLSAGQVSAVAHLVANSFENLRPEDVTVVDTAGRMWTKGSEEDNVLKLTASQLEYKRSVEKDMESRIQSMLEKTVGMNKAVARVSVDVDTKQVERTEETFDPNSQVVRSEQRNKEKTIGGAVAAGVPGVMSNLPDSAKGPQTPNVTPSQSQRQDEVINYEISKVVSRVVEPVGGIKKMSVAVLVDGNYETVKGADGKETKKYSARTDAELAKYTDMVKGAVGYTKDRGDVITVVSTPFESDVPDNAPETEKQPIVPPYLVPVLIKYGAMVLVAVLAIFLVARPVIKKLMQEREGVTMTAQSREGALGQGANEYALQAGARPAEEETIHKLKKVVKDNPQQVAMVLKGWIKEN